MSSAARATLESLLRARKLDTTLTSARPMKPSKAVQAPTGLSALDEKLGGGLPRGELSEVVGPRSSGRTRIATSAVAAATARGELAALVDTLDRFDPPSAAGLVWPHLLWIRGPSLGPADRPSPAGRAAHADDPLSRAVDRAIKAAALVLSAGGFGLLVVDFADVPPMALRRLPFTTWLRLERMLEGRDTACLILATEPVARSAGGVSLRADSRGAEPARWAGTSHRARRLAGLEVRLSLARARFASDDVCVSLPA